MATNELQEVKYFIKHYEHVVRVVGGAEGRGYSTCCVICFPRHTQEEREVLCSIYESDEYFKEHSPTSFTYRVYTVLQVPCDLTHHA